MTNQRKDLLRQLVRDGIYVVDERSVADAIVTRARAQAIAPGFCRQHGQRGREVRSFRCHTGVPSFRLTSARR